MDKNGPVTESRVTPGCHCQSPCPLNKQQKTFMPLAVAGGIIDWSPSYRQYSTKTVVRTPVLFLRAPEEVVNTTREIKDK